MSHAAIEGLRCHGCAGSGGGDERVASTGGERTAPSAEVLVPSNNTTVSGTQVVLDASASAGVTQVQFELRGGSLSDSVIATATPTYYGWIALWNSTTVRPVIFDSPKMSFVALHDGRADRMTPHSHRPRTAHMPYLMGAMLRVMGPVFGSDLRVFGLRRSADLCAMRSRCRGSRRSGRI